jgi:G3E family GTPase
VGPRRQIPLLLLTGFLGSGKTTLLRDWLAEPNFAKTMVLVNEIGEVGVDQQLLAPAAGDPLLLENGCACCDAGGDLVAALEQLFFDRLHRKLPPFERVVIETTGLAAPSSIVGLLSASEILRERYGAPVVLTTFDAAHGPSQFDRHPEVRDQIGAAHAVVLTRTDLATDAEIDTSSALLARERPEVAVLASGRAALPAKVIVDLLAASPARQLFHYATGETQHSAGLSTAFAPIAGPVTAGALAAALDALFRDGGSSILRVKGFIALKDDGLCSVQADPSRTTVEPAAAAPSQLGLTLIAQGRSAADLAASLAAKLAVRKLSV